MMTATNGRLYLQDRGSKGSSQSLMSIFHIIKEKENGFSKTLRKKMDFENIDQLSLKQGSKPSSIVLPHINEIPAKIKSSFTICKEIYCRS
jgi:hypothetical protein